MIHHDSSQPRQPIHLRRRQMCRRPHVQPVVTTVSSMVTTMGRVGAVDAVDQTHWTTCVPRGAIHGKNQEIPGKKREITWKRWGVLVVYFENIPRSRSF